MNKISAAQVAMDFLSKSIPTAPTAGVPSRLRPETSYIPVGSSPGLLPDARPIQDAIDFLFELECEAHAATRQRMAIQTAQIAHQREVIHDLMRQLSERDAQAKPEQPGDGVMRAIAAHQRAGQR